MGCSSRRIKMTITAKTLISLKNSIETRKSEKERKEGALQLLEKQLKDEYGCDTTEAAEALLDVKEKALETKQEALDKYIRQLNEAMI